MQNTEQPAVVENTHGADAQTSTSGSVNSTLATDAKTGVTANAGSTALGKFKDIEALSKAYASLEGEFTKRSQKLSSLEKELSELKASQKISTAAESPSSSSTDWNSKVDTFLSKYPKASKLASEISSILVDDSVLANSDNALELAYARVLENKYALPEELAGNENFLQNYIYTNEVVRSKIIAEYLQAITKTNVPATISGDSGQISALPNSKPRSVFEAGKMALDFFRRG